MMAGIELNGLDQALSRAGDGACVVASDGRVASWNRAAERMLGYTAREAIGRRCCDLFGGRDDHGNRLCHAGCRVMTLLSMNEPISHFEMLAQAKDGRTVWLDVSVLGLSNGNGNGNGNGTHGNGGTHTNGSTNGHGTQALHLFRDVTEAKEILSLVRERFAPAPAVEGETAGVVLLTRRELEVLRLVAGGGNTKSIAESLHLSTATVRNHVQNIFGKLGAHSRLEAVAYAHRHRLV
jgi:PAS domain S-box-containing protein